jgi:hypothetical protein
MTNNENNFPVLDAPHEDTTILDEYGMVEAHVAETDDWVALPVRLTLACGAGFCIEVGPYSLMRSDIEVLRGAIIGYDLATGRSTGMGT